MKNIITTTILFVSVYINAQTYQTIKPIENSGSAEYGVYYKDYNNVFDDFEGTYEYNGNDFYFKMILKKRELDNNNNYFWQDMLIGGYQYAKNGLILANTLNDANLILDQGWKYKLKFRSIWNPEDNKFCNDCLQEKWLRGSITDLATGTVASLYMAKKIENGQEGIEIWFHFHAMARDINAPEPPPVKLPGGQFFLKKIAD